MASFGLAKTSNTRKFYPQKSYFSPINDFVCLVKEPNVIPNYPHMDRWWMLWGYLIKTSCPYNLKFEYLWRHLLEVTTTVSSQKTTQLGYPLHPDFAIYTNFGSVRGWSFVNCHKAKDMTCCLSLANMSQCQAATPKCSLNLPYTHNLRSATLQFGCVATIKIFHAKNNLNVWLKLPSNWFPSI